MKKNLLSFILLFSYSSYGMSYLLYPSEGKEASLERYIVTEYNVVSQRVFSPTETLNPDIPSTIRNTVKVKIPDSLVEKFISDKFILNSTHKIERNSKLELLETQNGEFEFLQWGLRNTGVPIELKLTDIDRHSLNAKKGEDINLGILKEVEGRKIRVAVIDSGLDLTHPEFKNLVYRNESECKAWERYTACLAQNTEDSELTTQCHNQWAKTDTDQNGYPMDCHGWNVAAPVSQFTGIQGNNDVMDIVGHGTHISGIIAAANDQQGITGVIRNVEILPVKVSGSTDEIQEDNSTDIFAKGILYALKQNVDIINLSVGWSSSEDSLLVSELIKKAHELGVLVVIAGGNSAHSTETYPCAYNEVICVGSHNPDGSRSHFSNFGNSIDIYAPGHNILSTWPLELRPKLFTARHGYEFKNGTSFSSPFVVGVLARLLNLGFSPDEARAKLLRGARKSELNLDVVNGNVDLAKSALLKINSFIYPFKKSAAFMNWHEGEKKFVLKIKNYVQSARNVKLELVSRNNEVKIKDSLRTFETWDPNEIKDISFSLEGSGEVPSDMYFDLKIKSSDENKSYPVQVVATTVIHDKFSRPDTEHFDVQTNKDLESFDFTPVLNLVPTHDTDFLISQIVDGKMVVGLLKLIDGKYRLSRLHATIFDKQIIIQAAKIDLNLDGHLEYVLTGMYQNQDKKWVAKFYVFDEVFRLSDIQVCPDNEHVNLLTSMGTELNWIKKNGRMVPTWMAMGYAPSIDLPRFDPWVPRVVNEFKKRIYYLDDKGLRTLSMPTINWIDFGPIKFFPQSKNDLKEGQVKFLYTQNKDFVKTYALGSTNELEPQSDYVFGRYQNLYPLNGLSFPNTQDLVFSEIESLTGHGRLSVLSPYTNIVEQREFEYLDILDPVQLVLDKTPNGNFFAHTKYNLLYLEGDNVHKTESRNANQQIQYKRLKNLEALYLNSDYTPGLSSELIQFDNGKIIRPAKYRFLIGNGCQEIGYDYSLWEDQDRILFYCDNSKSIFKVQLNEKAQ